MATNERTDAERMALCFLNSVGIWFYNMGKKGVEVGDCMAKSGNTSRAIRSSKHALNAWRKAVDKCMRNTESR